MLIFYQIPADTLLQIRIGLTDNELLILVSHFVESGKTQSHNHPVGGGMQAKASKIVILCYFLSIFYLSNCCKNIHKC